MYSMILAMDKNGLIGDENRLPWDLPYDLNHFKLTTTAKIIVMGRNTFDSIGRALPNRTNVVITRDENFKADNVIVFNSLKDFEVFAQKQEKEIIIIGGANLIKQLYDNISTLYITEIDNVFKGDCYVDFIKKEELTIVEEFLFKIEDGQPYDFSIKTYTK